MDRKEFISILGATPFAVKSLITDKPKDEAVKEVSGIRDINVPQCILKNNNGREIALVKNIDFEMTQGSFMGQPGKRSWNISFYDSPTVSDDYNRLVKALQAGEGLIADIYFPEHQELFFTGKGYMTEISIDLSDFTISGGMQGKSMPDMMPT